MLNSELNKDFSPSSELHPSFYGIRIQCEPVALLIVHGILGSILSRRGRISGICEMNRRKTGSDKNYRTLSFMSAHFNNKFIVLLALWTLDCGCSLKLKLLFFLCRVYDADCWSAEIYTHYI